jgi:hypothetical protein
MPSIVLPFKNTGVGSDTGIDVTLPNENVASRILPVRIHEIDVEDVRLLKNELIFSLRSIDWFYLIKKFFNYLLRVVCLCQIQGIICRIP